MSFMRSITFVSIDRLSFLASRVLSPSSEVTFVRVMKTGSSFLRVLHACHKRPVNRSVSRHVVPTLECKTNNSMTSLSQESKRSKTASFSNLPAAYKISPSHLIMQPLTEPPGSTPRTFEAISASTPVEEYTDSDEH